MTRDVALTVNIYDDALDTCVGGLIESREFTYLADALAWADTQREKYADRPQVRAELARVDDSEEYGDDAPELIGQLWPKV